MPLTLRPTALSSPAYRDWADYIIVEGVLDVVHDPQRTYRAMARAHGSYTFLATNTTNGQPEIGREPVGTFACGIRRA
jgi:hypothetical protein